MNFVGSVVNVWLWTVNGRRILGSWQKHTFSLARWTFYPLVLPQKCLITSRRQKEGWIQVHLCLGKHRDKTSVTKGVRLGNTWREAPDVCETAPTISRTWKLDQHQFHVTVSENQDKCICKLAEKSFKTLMTNIFTDVIFIKLHFKICYLILKHLKFNFQSDESIR